MAAQRRMGCIEMNEARGTVVHRWIQDNLPFLTIDTPITAHIDTLVDVDIPSEDILRTATQLFRTLVSSVLELKVVAKPGLVIPLTGHSLLLNATAPRTRNEIVAQLDREPPSIYLLDWDVFRFPEKCEEYKYPLGFDLLEYPVGQLYTYYREFRYPIGITNGWEYSRSVYVEYYPQFAKS